MSASIEWGHARNLTPYILNHFEEAGDHQSVADDSTNPEDVGLMLSAGGDGFCLVGTPIELLKALAEAMSAVTGYLQRTAE
jgi:hypothetical protein